MTHLAISPPRPIVSVLLPTYNRLRFLPQAIESVRAQTRADWEMIVVDDGSDDGTAEYLAATAASDSRIRVMTRPRAGCIPRLRNVAAAEARGTYLAFLDSDDFWHPAKLEKQLAAIDATPGARWSYVRHVPVREDGQPMPRASRTPRSGWIFRAYLERKTGMAVPSVVVERDLFHQVGGFDEAFEMAEDHDLWLRLAAAAPVAGVDEALTFVRMHPTRTTRLSPVPPFHWHIAVYEKCLRSVECAELRALCRRNQAALAVLTAWAWYVRRRPLRALASVCRSLRYDPRGAPLWRYLGRPALRRLARGMPWPRRERRVALG